MSLSRFKKSPVKQFALECGEPFYLKELSLKEAEALEKEDDFRMPLAKTLCDESGELLVSPEPDGLDELLDLPPSVFKRMMACFAELYGLSDATVEEAKKN